MEECYIRRDFWFSYIVWRECNLIFNGGCERKENEENDVRRNREEYEEGDKGYRGDDEDDVNNSDGRRRRY